MGEPFQKGRYWNYEEDRWSFCNSDDDEDREIEVKRIVNEEKAEAAGEPANAAANEEDEWEYYYEDVDIKAKENADKPAPKQEQVKPAPKQEQVKPALKQEQVNPVPL